MAKTQAKSKELGNSVNTETLKKEVAEGFEKLSKKQQPVKGSVEDQIKMHIQNMERAKEIYLRSLGALEVLESMKKGDSDGRSKPV